MFGALRAAALTLSGSFSTPGAARWSGSRALNGPAFIMPTPFDFKYGIVSSAKRVFWSVYWL